MRKYAGNDEKWQKYFSNSTNELKMISNYTKLNFNEVLDLPYSLYLLYRKDAWVDSWRGSAEGANFLKDLWRLQQTEPDMQSVKKFNERGYLYEHD